MDVNSGYVETKLLNLKLQNFQINLPHYLFIKSGANKNDDDPFKKIIFHSNINFFFLLPNNLSLFIVKTYLFFS